MIEPQKWGDNHVGKTPAPDELKLARAILQLEGDLRMALNGMNNLLQKQSALTEVAYLLAGFEKKPSGGYGPVEGGLSERPDSEEIESDT